MTDADAISPPEQPQAALDPDQQRLFECAKSLVEEHVVLDVDREKIFQYMEARKSEAYYRGIQYIYPVLVGGMVTDWNPVSGGLDYNQTPEEREAQYDYCLNVIRGDGRKFIAVLGQRGPNVKGQARREDDDAGVRRARRADQASTYLRSQWSPERVQRQLALSLWKNGTTFAYTPWVADGDKYGVVNEPVIEAQLVPGDAPFYGCIQCGTEVPQADAGQPPHCTNPLCPIPGGYMFQPQDLRTPGPVSIPVITGMKPYPKGCVEMHIATIFEVTVPFYCKSLKDAPWLWYEYEEHKGKLMAAFPQLKSLIGEEEWNGSDNTGLSSQGRLARELASSPTGAFVTPRKNRWCYSRFWLRPAMYELIQNESLRALMYQRCPDGAKITRVQDHVVAVDPEKLDDVWACCKPDTSEYIFADPICKDYLPLQDVINDMFNLAEESFERSIPWLIADPTVLDVLQVQKQRGKPGQIIPAKAGVGSRLADSIFKAPVANIDPEVISWINTVHSSARENAGIIPAMWGGGPEDTTARAAELRRNQALQQLDTVWNEMRDFWSGAYYNGVRQLARHAAPDGINLGQYEQTVGDFEDLLGGGWFFTTEEAMPQTWGQKRDLVMFILQAGPEAAAIFGLQNPQNLAIVQEVLGLVGWKIPNLDARDKVLATIKQLLAGQPQPGPNPGQQLPSIPPDQFEDDHMFVVSMLKEWAQTEEARTVKDSNPQGYANVIAWGQAHMQLAGPPGGGPPPGGPGGGAPGMPPPQMGPGGPQMSITPNLPGQPMGASAPPPPGATLGGPPISPQPGQIIPPSQ